MASTSVSAKGRRGKTPPGTTRGAAEQHRRQLKLRPAGFGWILPALVLSVGVIYFCIGYNGFLSTQQNKGGIDGGTFIGLDNYRNALSNPLFWGALKHTLIFFLVVSLVQIGMGIIFAAMLHSKIHLAVVYKVIIFMPFVIAPAIMAPVHRQVFATEGPLNWILTNLKIQWLCDHIGINWVLEHLHLPTVAAQSWLAQTSTSLLVVIGVQIWSTIGFAFILFYASMGQIEPEMIEAARIDGATNPRILISLVVPSVRGTVLALLILNAITALKLFDYPYLMTRGGPVYTSDFLGTYIHREAVTLTNLGYAGALSILLLILAIGASVVMSLWSRRGE
ncbi:MAG: sugar ABC transporter permease [Bifidobacteriaceae bacterium]|jgi:raffinose/stachyose/melibiose transport system permease protein|nr:sugar ABC transporter permease [Bifidobacteriaceae bacterium]